VEFGAKCGNISMQHELGMEHNAQNQKQNELGDENQKQHELRGQIHSTNQK
jgi:hypothetical protein